MDFSIPTVYVLPVGGTLATTGGSSALTAGKLGIFTENLQTVVTAATAAATPKIKFAMGRFPNELTTLSKKSDVISKTRIIDYYINPAVTARQEKIVTISDLNATCGSDITVTLRAFSKALDISYQNGLTRSFTAFAPCCDCGEDPCAAVADADVVVMLNDLVAQINASVYDGFIVASVGGVADARTIILTGQVPAAGPTSANPAFNQYDGPDYVNFYAYVYRGAATTMDNIVAKRCDEVGTVTETQLPTFAHGSSDEVKLVEWRNYSYQTPYMKSTFNVPEYNVGFVSNVVDGQFYSEVVIKFRPVEDHLTWGQNYEQDEIVRIFTAPADLAQVTAVLNAFLGTAPIANED